MNKNMSLFFIILIAISITISGCVSSNSPPTGTIFKNKMSSGDGTLEIKNGLSYDAVAVLSASNNPKVSVFSVFIRAHDSYTINNIPDNNYILYYTLGEDWNKETGKFNVTKESSRFDDEAVYTTNGGYFTTYKATLDPVPGGNASTKSVNIEDFPE